MLTDQQMIDLMVSEPSWEDVIVRIVAEEQMDPWSIDLIKLSDVFVEYLKKLEELDLRIPARFILIASILLRMKSDVLSPQTEQILIAESEKPEDEMLRVLAQVPPLEPPIKRKPTGNVSMNELIRALKKAFEVRERRIHRRVRIRRMVERAVPEAEEDITERITSLLEEIESALEELDNIEFSRLVKKWGREEIVKTLIPLLHLANKNKIKLIQRELFKEIFIKRSE